MSCVNDGILRSQIDGELSAAEKHQVDSHLTTCPECRRRADEIARRAGQVQTAFAALLPPPDQNGGAQAQWARFEARMALEKTSEAKPMGFFAKLFGARLRPAWAGAALAAVLIAFLGVAPARSWAQRILAMLRVQKIAVLPLDPDLLSGRNPNLQTGKLIAQVLSDNVVVTESPGKATQAATGDEASQLAGFRVRTLTGRSDAPRIQVEGERAFHMTLNRDRLQGILNEAGRSDLQLPASIDGDEVAVRLPKAAIEFYGNCPKEPDQAAANRSTPPSAGGRSMRPRMLKDWSADRSTSPQDAGDCVVLLQSPSPTVSVPPDLNISQLAEAGLELAGMSAADAHTFCETVDWTSTLVIPVPRTANSYATTIVDGVQGTLIDLQPHAPGPPRRIGYTLIWIKSGIIYSLAGMGNPAEAVPLAGTLD